MMLVGDDEDVKTAAIEGEQEVEVGFEEAAKEEKDVKLEMAAEAALKKTEPLDLVLQYCIGGASKCKDSNTKQLKAYPNNIYKDSLKDWKYFSAKLPDEVVEKKGTKLQLRFYQKQHTCWCCDQFAIDDLKIVEGGWPLNIMGDEEFTVWGDGNLIGSGEWWDPAKDTYHFRVNATTRTFVVKITGIKNEKANIYCIIWQSYCK